MISKLHEKKIKQLIHKIGLKYNLTDKQVEEIINSQYEFIKEKILEVDIEDEDNLKSNFLIKYLGKLYIDVRKVKNKREFYEQRRNANKHES